MTATMSERDAREQSRTAAWLAAKTKNVQKKHRMVLEKELRKTKMCKYFQQGKPCYAGANCDFAHSEKEINSKPILSKTQLCINFAEGRCNDKNCNFAHGEDELRKTEWRQHDTAAVKKEEPADRAPLKEVISRLPQTWTTKQKLAAAIARHSESQVEVDYAGSEKSNDGFAANSADSTNCGESHDSISDGASASDQMDSRGSEEFDDDMAQQEKSNQSAKLCKFYVQGYCHFGLRCHFAHSVKEMHAAPDVRKTILCPVWSEKGKCEDPTCAFAHGNEDLCDMKWMKPHPEQAESKSKKKKTAQKKLSKSEAHVDMQPYGVLQAGPVTYEDRPTKKNIPGTNSAFQMMKMAEPMKIHQADEMPLGQDLGKMMCKMEKLSAAAESESTHSGLKSEIAELRESISLLTAQISKLGQPAPAARQQMTPLDARARPYVMSPMPTVPMHLGYDPFMDLHNAPMGCMPQPMMLAPPPGLM